MATFPLRARPAQSYHHRPLAFGSPRDGGARKHAGCDLYAPAGTEVLAVEAGIVTRGPYLFYDGVYAIEVTHSCGVVRYGEIESASVQEGMTVSEGQVIALVGKMATVPQSMLHFELYAGNRTGPLTVRGREPYHRRYDLMDPTAFLDGCVCL